MQPFEMISSTRRSLRRSVELSCDVLVSQSGVSREHMLDLSTRGACITSTSPLSRDEELLVAFAPPGLGASIDAIARVAHVARPALSSSDMLGIEVVGLEFASLPASAHRDIERCLRGLPPPLPSLRRRIELAWLDLDMSWEEDLGDQLNVFSATERITMVDDGFDLIEVVGPAAAVRLPVHIRTA